MQIVLVTLVVFGLVTLAMSIGTLLGRAPLRGSCGGVAGGECPCSDEERNACAKRGRW